MATRQEIEERLTYWRSALQKLMDAYIALVEGQVKSYENDDRSVTRLDLLPSLKKAYLILAFFLGLLLYELLLLDLYL